jgi:hypothetical protein
MKKISFQRLGLLLLFCLVLPWTPARSQSSDEDRPNPIRTTAGGDSVSPVSAGKIVREAGYGCMCGLLGSIVFGFIGGLTASGQNDFWSGMERVGMGVVVGSTIGSSAGVYITAREEGERGSYGSALAGSVLGMAVFLGTKPFEGDSFPWLGLYGLPAFGSLIGYNLSQRIRRPAAGGDAVLDFTPEGLAVGVPAPYLRWHPGQRPFPAETMDLIRFRF